MTVTKKVPAVPDQPKTQDQSTGDQSQQSRSGPYRARRSSQYGGSSSCLPQMESKSCACPAQWSEWGPWSGERPKCVDDPSKQWPMCTRTRTCKQCSSTGGKNCEGPAEEEKECGSKIPLCPMWLQWGPWSENTMSCTPSTMAGSTVTCMRKRKCSEEGKCEGESSQSRDCLKKPQPCAMWSEWGPWSENTMSCTPGSMSNSMMMCTRTRTCSEPGQCPGKDTEERMCLNSPPPCAMWSQWSPWTENTMTCTPSNMAGSMMLCNRKRTCSEPGRCPGDSMETRMCQSDPEPCASWGPWSPWSENMMSCTPSKMQNSMMMCSRKRMCNPEEGQCPGDDKQERMCTSSPPPCAQWNPWGAWSENMMSCTPGSMLGMDAMCNRKRTCSEPGECPGPDTETRTCLSNPPPCATWSEWGPWSQPDVSCLPMGKSAASVMCSRTRTCSEPGFCPGESEQTGPCMDAPKPCPMWSEWGPWSTCDATCGAGKQMRKRTCLNGPGCVGPDSSEQPCESKGCPMWEAWEPWSSCSASCGTGSQSRKRWCLNGPGCVGPDSSEKSCESKGCPMWEDWEPWSSCSASCGAGDQSRKRWCLNGPGCQGDSDQKQPCTSGDCPSPPTSAPSEKDNDGTNTANNGYGF